MILCGANICLTLRESRSRTWWHCVLQFLSVCNLHVYSSALHLGFFAGIFLNLVNGIIQCLFFCVWLLLLSVIFVKYTIVCKLIFLPSHCYLVFSIWFYHGVCIHSVHVHLLYFQSGAIMDNAVYFYCCKCISIVSIHGNGIF